MTANGILDLPAELLDRIYSYIDWDHTASLIPKRDDVFNISLTCKHLRQSAIPLIFRNVTLRLRCTNGGLLEPRLYLLRRQRPDLAQHVRCVHISTRLGHRPYGKDDNPYFSTPQDLEDWLNPELVVWPGNRHYVELNAAHRERVQVLVKELARKVSESHGRVEDVGTAEHVIRQMVAKTVYPSQMYQNLPKITELHTQAPSARPVLPHPLHHGRHQRRLGLNVGFQNDDFDVDGDPSIPEYLPMQPEDQQLKRQADALAVVMLCLPATVTALVIESCIQDTMESPANKVGMHVAAAAMEVFSTRLESLTVAISHHRTTAGRVREPPTPNTITLEIISKLTNLKALILSTTADPAGAVPVGLLQSDVQLTDRWTSLPTHTLSHLEIWNMTASTPDLAKLHDLAKALSPLQTIRLQNICISTVNARNMGQDDVRGRSWLGFLTSLRRSIPTAVILLGNLNTEHQFQRTALSASALRWLATEAIPIGVVIDAQREERLFEDFESFLPLWEAEDSARGEQAAEQRKSGVLVDAAMCSRWKQFENVRKDRGEWTTM